jgi:hypothetical protein
MYKKPFLYKYTVVFKVSEIRGRRELGVLRLSEVEVHTIPESPGVYVVCWIKEGDVVPVPRRKHILRNLVFKDLSSNDIVPF